MTRSGKWSNSMTKKLYHLKNQFGINKQWFKKWDVGVDFPYGESDRLNELLARRTQYYNLEEIEHISEWLITDHHECVQDNQTDGFSPLEVYTVLKYLDKVDKICQKIREERKRIKSLKAIEKWSG